jgi:HTH-type transcriptional regulator / antitoxin HipB
MNMRLISSPQILGAIIKDKRKSKKLTQAQLAGKAMITSIALSHIESGRDGTRLHSILKILSALDMELMTGDKSKTTLNGDEW